MSSFTDELTNLIIKQEASRLNDIMHYVAEKIQEDVVGVTRDLIDAYYKSYMPPDRTYIRVDEWNKNRKSRKIKNRNKNPKRGRDKSLMSAIKQLEASGEPAIGVCRPLDNACGWQAGVCFDSRYFSKNMHHQIRGIDEFDMVNNFLYSETDGRGNHPKMQRSPEANDVLLNYINTYSSRFDKHYKDACNKF